MVDLASKEIFLHGESIGATKTEFEILLYLVQAEGRVVFREELIAHIWRATPYITERTVDVHITRLRKKLAACASWLTNRAGYGYRFVPSDNPPSPPTSV